ncbi:hypothetical protein AVEN_265184-1 [Araneus ventricosus]|uniref:Uncharacterized protein n=1 Tax=Araneus ventricosus TaxID=182803 RepID=A0A4Y2CQQ7_ARAVE|nr:hypothetical protein AVEN_265184-1 [Araneus ventricosus]
MYLRKERRHVASSPRAAKVAATPLPILPMRSGPSAYSLFSIALESPSSGALSRKVFGRSLSNIVSPFKRIRSLLSTVFPQFGAFVFNFVVQRRKSSTHFGTIPLSINGCHPRSDTDLQLFSKDRIPNSISLPRLWGRGGLVVRSLLRGRRVRGWKHDSTEDLSSLLHAKSYVLAKRPPVAWCESLANSGVVLVI